MLVVVVMLVLVTLARGVQMSGLSNEISRLRVLCNLQSVQVLVHHLPSSTWPR